MTANNIVRMPARRGLVAAVAENVRVESARRGFNQSQLGRALGTSSTSVNSRWWGDERPWQLDDLEQVAKVLGIPISRLLKYEDRYTARDSNPEPAD